MKVNVNVAALPLPRAGLTPAAVNGPDGPPGTFHTPRACQPLLFCAMSRAARYTTLFPAKLALNVKLRLRLRLLPAPLTDDAATLIAHWLLERVPADPFNTTPGRSALPASFTRYSTFNGWL